MRPSFSCDSPAFSLIQFFSNHIGQPSWTSAEKQISIWHMVIVPLMFITIGVIQTSAGLFQLLKLSTWLHWVPLCLPAFRCLGVYVVLLATASGRLLLCLEVLCCTELNHSSLIIMPYIYRTYMFSLFVLDDEAEAKKLYKFSWMKQ